MYSYQNAAKKKVWKWTAGKIAAFVAFGIMTTALFYVESTSDQSTYSSSPVATVEPEKQVTQVSSFDKEYQDFLKQGKKIVSQQTLDSLEQAEPAAAPPASAPSTNRPVEQPRNKPVVETSKNSVKTKSPNSDNLAQRRETQVENNLQPVQLTPSSGSQSTPPGNLLGSLEELDPEEVNNITNARETADVSNEEVVITEEFYTEEIITGTISAVSNRAPLQGVEITVKGAGIKAISDAKGNYSIKVPGDPLYRTVRYTYQGNATEREVAPGTEILNIRF